MERHTCKHKACFPFVWLFSLIVLYVTQSACGIYCLTALLVFASFSKCIFIVCYAGVLGKTDCKHTISQSVGVSERGENAGI